ncbi:hypothetical protein [Methylobacter sp.]
MKQPVMMHAPRVPSFVTAQSLHGYHGHDAMRHGFLTEIDF